MFFKLARSEFHEDGRETEKERGPNVLVWVQRMWRFPSAAERSGQRCWVPANGIIISQRYAGAVEQFTHSGIISGFRPTVNLYQNFRRGEIQIRGMPIWIVLWWSDLFGDLCSPKLNSDLENPLNEFPNYLSISIHILVIWTNNRFQLNFVNRWFWSMNL